jgi:hypothetical protein
VFAGAVESPVSREGDRCRDGLAYVVVHMTANHVLFLQSMFFETLDKSTDNVIGLIPGYPLRRVFSIHEDLNVFSPVYG